MPHAARSILLAATFAFTSLPAAAQVQPARIAGCGKAQAAALAEAARQSIVRPFADDPGAGVEYAEAYPDTDVLENNLDIEVVLSPQTVRGSNTMTVRALTSGLTEFSIILHPNFTASALINGSTPGAMTTFGTWGRRITLDRAYAAGETFTVKVSYQGTPPPPTGFGGFVIQTRSGKPEVWTLSQPFAAGCWWPCKDGDSGLPGDNSDKATLKLAVTCPSTLKTTANGLLQGVDDLGDGRSRTRFVSNYPMSTYLVCFASTDFNTWTVPWTYNGTTMPVEFNFYSEQDSASARANASNVLGMLTVFSDLFGTYPFINEKYGIYQFGFGGGMEHQTNTGQIFFDGGWLSAHELAHQWWGDNLTCRDWHHIWLNEGFATYAEALWEEFKPGSSGKPALLAAMQNRRPSNPAAKVYVDDTSSEVTIFDQNSVYDKAGWVLHMLRYTVGDQVFFPALRAYRQAHELGAVVTEDLQATFSAMSGKDLTAFFQQWIYGTGVPNYRTAFQNVAIAGQQYARVYFAQTQSTSLGYQGMFRMPVDLQLGSLATDPVVRVNNTARAQWFLFPVSKTLSAITIDPDNRILTGSKGGSVWVNGPAKVVKTSIAPGASRSQAAGVTSVDVWFSEPVQIDPARIVLTGPQGTVPCTVTPNSATTPSTISFGALPAGSYTLKLSEQIVTVASSKLLDGEVANPADAASLPSGDGVPGGDALISFEIRCPADVNRDHMVTLEDFFAFFNAWDVSGPDADINENSTVDLSDFFAFFAGFDVGC